MCGIAQSILQRFNLVVMDVLCHRFCLHNRYCMQFSKDNKTNMFIFLKKLFIAHLRYDIKENTNLNNY